MMTPEELRAEQDAYGAAQAIFTDLVALQRRYLWNEAVPAVRLEAARELVSVCERIGQAYRRIAVLLGPDSANPEGGAR